MHDNLLFETINKLTSKAWQMFPALLTSLCLVVSSTLAALLQTLAVTAAVATVTLSGTAMAQTSAAPGDIEPPMIELEEIKQGVAGEDQVFTALVSDDNGVEDVKLYFRYRGQQAFQTVPMKALGSSAFYVASIETDADETRPIEYYVQALDTLGNREVNGFAFEPLVRVLDAPVETVATATEPPKQQKSGGLKVWHIVVGVLAAGALAAAVASSSGGGGGGSGPSDEMVPLTITITSP